MGVGSVERFLQEPFWYGFLQLGVPVTFLITAVRAWRHSRARFAELLSAFLFGLLLEQGDIFLFGTYRYNQNWVLVGDVPIAIALTWALIIAGAMNITDALGIQDASAIKSETARSEGKAGSKVKRNGVLRWVMAGLPAPMADAVWAILLDLALDAVAIRLGLWTWTIRADEGWFGVPWGNFFAWLLVAFWFSLFTRWVRARRQEDKRNSGSLPSGWLQWTVPLLAFAGLIAALVPFVALENTAALPFAPDRAQIYHNEVWIVFAGAFGLFVAVTWWALLQTRLAREAADHWLLAIRLMIHLLFLAAVAATGMYLDAPLLLVVAVALLVVELVLTHTWFVELGITIRGMLRQMQRGRA